MTFGDLELVPLFDGFFKLDGGAMFGVVPKPLWEKRAPADARNRIDMAMRPLLVRPSTRSGQAPSTGSGQAGPVVLVDAGVGDKMADPKTADIYAFDRTENLDVTLARAGVRAADIQVVVASHLHFDHAGGFTVRGDDGGFLPRFPGARYAINRGEWEEATHPHERTKATYFLENYVPLHEAGLVDFNGDEAQIVPGIRVQRTGGHTRNHQIVYIESAGRTAVFAADLIPMASHVDVPWIMAYDLFPMETLEFKRRFVREAIDREYLIFFEHDPKIAAGYIREKGGKLSVEPVL